MGTKRGDEWQGMLESVQWATALPTLNSSCCCYLWTPNVAAAGLWNGHTISNSFSVVSTSLLFSIKLQRPRWEHLVAEYLCSNQDDRRGNTWPLDGASQSGICRLIPGLRMIIFIL